jgi:hypothetical protein
MHHKWIYVIGNGRMVVIQWQQSSLPGGLQSCFFRWTFINLWISLSCSVIHSCRWLCFACCRRCRPARYAWTCEAAWRRCPNSWPPPCPASTAPAFQQCLPSGAARVGVAASRSVARLCILRCILRVLCSALYLTYRIFPVICDLLLCCRIVSDSLNENSFIYSKHERDGWKFTNSDSKVQGLTWCSCASVIWHTNLF